MTPICSNAPGTTAPPRSTPSSPASSAPTVSAPDDWIRTGPATIEWNGYRIAKSCCGDVGRTSGAYHAYAPGGAFIGVCGGEAASAKQLCYDHARRPSR